jgi:hypothetical protein
MTKRRRADDATLSLLDLMERVEETAQELLEDLKTDPQPPEPECDGRDSEAELYGEINAAVIEAIRESGLSREQVVDFVNAQFRRCLGDDIEAKRPTTVNMLNNYLADSKRESRMPFWLLDGICSATRSLTPLETLARRHGAYVVTDRELMEQRLGKLDQMQRELAASKAEVRRMLTKMRTGE